MNEKGNMNNVTAEREKKEIHEEKEQHDHTILVLIQPYPF